MRGVYPGSVQQQIPFSVVSEQGLSVVIGKPAGVYLLDIFNHQNSTQIMNTATIPSGSPINQESLETQNARLLGYLESGCP